MEASDAFPSLIQALAKPLFESGVNISASFSNDHYPSTPNLFFNALVLAMVPVCVQLALYPTHLETLGCKLKGALVGGKTSDLVLRQIKALTRYGQYCVLDEHENRHGHILQKAIAAHLTDVLQLRGKGVRYEMVEHELDDSTQEQLNMVSKRTSDYWCDEDDGADMYEELNRLRIASLPKFQEWVEVEKGIYFQQYLQNPEDEENSRDTPVRKTKEVTVVYAFKSNECGASKRIDKFINNAFAKYQLLELLKLANDKKRYMYVQAVQEAKPSGDGELATGENKSTPAVMYKRYALSGEKSFKNLFFDEKQQLLQLLHSFMARSGKFAIKGFPYKLGLLLHGPPGTGKTSLIKAVAQHTKRHIVTVSLGKVKTNQELMNALFDLRFAVEGVDLPVNMTFEDVVFVMEDIDCATSVVITRENKPEASRRQRKRYGSSSASDKLNLSGLLNVLDGVIDCPGRIVIMTTNHPEKLDPALIRPGRVNKKLMLGYMNSVQVQNMVEYYFATSFTLAQTETLRNAVTEGTTPITPAAVEALCCEHDDIDAALVDFRHMLQVTSPAIEHDS